MPQIELHSFDMSEAAAITPAQFAGVGKSLHAKGLLMPDANKHTGKINLLVWKSLDASPDLKYKSRLRDKQANQH